MPEDFLLSITGKQFLERLASFLLCEGDPQELELDKYCSREQLSYWFYQAYREAPQGEPYALAEWYVEQNLFVPGHVVRALLEDRKPKKGGRHTHREQWAQQKASDAACFMAMEHLRKSEPNLSQTAAGERVGGLMKLSRAAVVRAWKKELKLGNPPETPR
jgi:hypothetical protein